MTVGETIRAYRKSQKLTQNQLGQLCGLTGGAISGYEKGSTVPKRRVLEKIARALNVPAEKLIGDPSFLPAEPVSPAPQTSDTLLYNGVLTVLKELYGLVEGRMVMGENGASKKYYVVNRIPGSFVLYEEDIAAIVRSAKASMPPLVEHMRRTRNGGQSA